MKRFSMLMLLAAATYALTGCMVTDYPCVTDTENQDYAACSDAGALALHDTNGWAHIIESSQTATDNNGDGIFTHYSPFISQDSNGNQMIGNTAEAAPNDPYNFHSDLYAQGNGKRLGVHAYGLYLNSTYTGTFPVIYGGETDTGDIKGSCVYGAAFDPFPFDYQLTTDCSVANDDLSTLVSYNLGDADREFIGNPVAEAGRSESSSGRIPLGMRLAALQTAAEATAEGLELTFRASDWVLTLEQDGFSQTLDMSAVDGLSIVWNPTAPGLIGNEAATAAGLTPESYLAIADQLAPFRRGQGITLTVEGFGETFTVPFALAHRWDPALTAGALATDGASGSSVGGRRR